MGPARALIKCCFSFCFEVSCVTHAGGSKSALTPTPSPSATSCNDQGPRGNGSAAWRTLFFVTSHKILKNIALTRPSLHQPRDLVAAFVRYTSSIFFREVRTRDEGTGSEETRFSVIAYPTHDHKRPLWRPQRVRQTSELAFSDAPDPLLTF